MGAEPGQSPTRARTRVRIEGVVQGVGFRPHVHSLATELGLSGFVGNDARGVLAEVEGTRAAVESFLVRLTDEAPPAAVVERVSATPVDVRGDTSFEIVVSDAHGPRNVAVSPDLAVCRECLAELWDPSDRRFRYPFINCTNCGPRYTIVRDVPYDRPTTTMAGFAMCDDCAREYHDPTDRRFHAQPVCCPACGPRLALLDADGAPIARDAVQGTAELLGIGRIVAIKGLGGYHLAVDATDDGAVARLRARKHREERPLAIMVADLDAVLRLCAADPQERALLTWPTAPIVLLRRRADDDGTIAASVAPGNRSLGVMLPYTPLHHLLADAFDRPFVLTSGNLSDEPIAHTDDDARTRLGDIADAFLGHDRPIHTRVDDSVVRVVGHRPLLVRRSRGYAPQPVLTGVAFPRPVLAVGAELKNTVCVAKGRRAYLSQHIGDLENYETHRSFTAAIAHLTRLFAVAPEVVAHDLHPDYLSTKYAVELDGVDLVGVQHHHAHIASCLADNGVAGPAIGVAFDGTGYGVDGTIWGGEVLVADLVSFRRVGHLEVTPLPGGAAAIREPWRMAVSWLRTAYGDDVPDGLAVVRRRRERWDAVRSLAAAGVNAPLTSSAGRLFDAVAALLGVRDRVSYEGQAAIELEQAADTEERGHYRARLAEAVRTGDAGSGDAGSGDAGSGDAGSGDAGSGDAGSSGNAGSGDATGEGGTHDVDDGAFAILGSDLVRGVVDDLRAGASVPVIAARFHNGVVGAIIDACVRVRDATALTTVALSGGVFQNVLLVERTVAGLRARGFDVLTHERVPPNDGGISFGQAVVAAARDRR